MVHRSDMCLSVWCGLKKRNTEAKPEYRKRYPVKPGPMEPEDLGVSPVTWSTPQLDGRE